MLNEINTAWHWKGFTAMEIIDTNAFGNVIFKTEKNDIWRLCPEEVKCDKIADSEEAYQNLLNDKAFLIDWLMENLVLSAQDSLGELGENEKYCLKLPGTFGGLYAKENLGKIQFSELIAFSGYLGFSIKDMKDGQAIKFNIQS